MSKRAWTWFGYLGFAPGIIFGVTLTPAWPMWQRIAVHTGLGMITLAFCVLTWPVLAMAPIQSKTRRRLCFELGLDPDASEEAIMARIRERR